MKNIFQTKKWLKQNVVSTDTTVTKITLKGLTQLRKLKEKYLRKEHILIAHGHVVQQITPATDMYPTDKMVAVNYLEKLRGLSLRANYTDRAAAADRRS